MSEPKNGYDKILVYDEKTTEQFRFLSCPDALRAMYFFAGRKSTVFFNEKTLACELPITEERGKEILVELKFDFVRAADFDSGYGDENICRCIHPCYLNLPQEFYCQESGEKHLFLLRLRV